MTHILDLAAEAASKYTRRQLVDTFLETYPEARRTEGRELCAKLSELIHGDTQAERMAAAHEALHLAVELKTYVMVMDCDAR